MRNLYSILFMLISIVPVLNGKPLVSISENIDGNLIEKQVVINVMKLVADWQIEDFKDVKHHELDWTNAALYIGMMELARLDEGSKYKQWLYDIGWKYRWQPYFRMYLADDMAVSQMYLEMYKIYHDKRMLEPTFARTEWIINHPSTSGLDLNYADYRTLERWSWCDALFMAPPVFAQMYSITGDVKYLEFMDKEYKNTYNYLYCKEEKLFFRDYRFFSKREPNGKKVFWGRGNGWVMAGLAKILSELPKDISYRKFYENLLIEMSERVGQLQDENGYWHASLLDPLAYPHPETSSTAFYVYALAFGINNGLLNKEIYFPIVLKGWHALENAVSPLGKIGWVQPIGEDPKIINIEMTEVYGVGAFLLAASEVYKLAN